MAKPPYEKELGRERSSHKEVSSLKNHYNEKLGVYGLGIFGYITLLTKLTKRKRRCVLCFSIFALLFLTSLSPSAQERSEAPVFSDRNFWQYRVVEHGEYMKTEKELNGVYELLYSNGRFKSFKIEGDQKGEVKSEGLLIGLLAQTENLQQLQFPLYKGKEWKTSYTFRPRRQEADRLVTAVTKVTDARDVAIDLGSFQALKIERDARFKNVDHWVYEYYWSPETKSVVKYSMEVLKGAAAGSKREIELIRFGLAR
jgi:hypothetical protein